MDATVMVAGLDRPLDPGLGAQLIRASRSGQLGPALLEAAHGLAEATEVFAYRLSLGRPPKTLMIYSLLGDASRRAHLYADQFHRLDPAASRLVAVSAGGVARHVLATEIPTTSYRSQCFDQPGFIDKLCFGWSGAEETTVISFYRQRNALDDQGGLSALASLGLSLLQASSDRGESLTARIEVKLMFSYPELTLRERQVCARTLAGWTSGQIAKALQIGSATVLTYRQRAYERLGFSSAGEFLDRLIA